jgi:flavin reductase (DIM6/NTAB) family NADH-FMN oxidoreductase RutF
MKEIPLTSVHSIIGASPVIMVATSDGTKNDVMTMSWFTMNDFNPPLVTIVMGDDHLSHDYLVKSRDCVIAVPGVDLMETALAVGSCTGRDVDKFAKYPITPVKAAEITAPLLEECLYNFECRIENDSLAGKYGLFVLKVVKAWSNPERKEQRYFNYRGNGVFSIPGEVRDLSGTK